MEINDIVYGSFEIKEPILIELINSKPMQRLKEIDQFMPKEMYHVPGYSRYEHCVGTMLLLKMLGASLKEQVAGLLHDVSHTAFSHLIDWIIGDRTKEDFQDKNHKKFILQTEIPKILEKHGFDVNEIADLEAWPLLDRDAPDLCADRVDYTLREISHGSGTEIPKQCVKNLIIVDKKIVLRSKESAKLFGENYMKLQTEHWGGTEAVTRYHIFAKVMKEGLKEGTINLEDFYETDDYVLKKVKESSNETIHKLLNLLYTDLSSKMDNENPTTIKKKFRYVDPEYADGGALNRLSENDAGYNSLLKEQRRINDKGINVNISLECYL